MSFMLNLSVFFLEEEDFFLFWVDLLFAMFTTAEINRTPIDNVIELSWRTAGLASAA